MKLFISYAKEDNETAQELYEDLKKLGFTPWKDSEDILPGERWESAIFRIIEDSSFFLALISSKSVVKKGFIQKELSKALDKMKEFPKSDIYIIPIRIDDCDIPYELKEIQYINLFPSYSRAVLKILQTILPNHIKSAPLSPIEKCHLNFSKNQQNSENLLHTLIKENKPAKANILQYSSDRIYGLLELFCNMKTEIFLLLQHPAVAKYAAGEFQRKKICAQIRELLITTLPNDFPDSKIVLRFYNEKASIRGLKFGNYINIGWYTYDIRSPKLGKNQIWGHDNPNITINLSSREGKIIEEAFDKTFNKLWENGTELKDVCGNCENALCILKTT